MYSSISHGCFSQITKSVANHTEPLTFAILSKRTLHQIKQVVLSICGSLGEQQGLFLSWLHVVLKRLNRGTETVEQWD